MKIIITGGSGLIGRRLTKNLTQNGHEVVILSRTPSKLSALPSGASVVQWDAKSSTGWEDEAEKADAIVNFAGANLAGEGFFPTRWSEDRKRLLYDSRINSGNAVVEAVTKAETKPKVVIQASAIGYYGPRGDEKITEESSPGSDYLARICVDWESSSEEVEKFGVRRVVIRSGIYLTPDDGALMRLLLPFKLFAGGPFGDGQQWYSWIHPTDEVEAIRFLIEHPDASGVFNLTSPNPEKNRDFAKILGRVMKRPSFMPVPGFALKTLFGEVTTVVLDGQRVLPERLQELGFSFKFPNLESALQDLLK
jgi:uncharacterized protein (TIGR01777 family)